MTSDSSPGRVRLLLIIKSDRTLPPRKAGREVSGPILTAVSDAISYLLFGDPFAPPALGLDTGVLRKVRGEPAWTQQHATTSSNTARSTDDAFIFFLMVCVNQSE